MEKFKEILKKIFCLPPLPTVLTALFGYGFVIAVAATVSVLSLETAMLAQFGGDDDPLFRRVMTGATGGVVCTVVIGMAIYMIIRANKNLKRIEINNSQT